MEISKIMHTVHTWKWIQYSAKSSFEMNKQSHSCSLLRCTLLHVLAVIFIVNQGEKS